MGENAICGNLEVEESMRNRAKLLVLEVIMQ